MQTFDLALFNLYEAGKISFAEAIKNADSANNLRLRIKLHSKRGIPADAIEDKGQDENKSSAAFTLSLEMDNGDQEIPE
jgi:twitching motility protein PilU